MSPTQVFSFSLFIQDVFKTSLRRLEDVLKTFLQDFLKTSSKCLEDVMARRLEYVLKTSWKRLEDVLKTYGQDEYIGLDQDVFWRRMTKVNIFVLIKTSWRGLQDVFWRRRWNTSSRRLHQDECLLGSVFLCLFKIYFPWFSIRCTFSKKCS